MGRPAILTTLVLALPSLVGAQEKVPVFRSAVELITVDAVVLDKAGRPVRGLKAEDFEITEGGKPQEVTSFEAVDLGDRPAAEPAASSPVATNLRSPRIPERAVVILVDDLGLAPPEIPPLVKALTHLMEGAFGTGDEVTLGSTSGLLWWSVRWPEGREDLHALADTLRGHKVAESASQFMSDWEAYRINLFEAANDTSSGTSRPGAAAAPAPVIPGTDITGRVVKRWIGTRVCAPENPGLCAQMVQMRASELDSLRRDRTRAIMAGVERAVFSLTGLRGRKELFLFSEGFLSDQELPLVQQVAGACREANLVVNFVDARGLVASIEEATAAFSGLPPSPQEQALVELERVNFESQGSVGLAEDTGGLAVSSTNDLAGGARRILDESRVYYLLGYYAPPGKGARAWRSLKVKVKRPGVRVRARKGYTLGTAEGLALAAPPQGSKRERSSGAGADAAGGDLETARALTSAVDSDGIPLRAMAYVFDEPKPGKARVLVAVEADLRSLDLRSGEDEQRATLDLTILATHRDTGAVARADEKLEIQRAAPGGWSLFTREFELAPGVSQARVVAKAEGSGRIGAVTARFEVPALSGLRLSTPILTDEVRPGARPEPVLKAHRVFKPSGILYCQFQVFGAAKDAQGTARVEASYLLQDASGAEVRRSERKPIATVPGGPVMRLLGLPLEGLMSGAYEFQLRVVDTMSGAALERAETFRLE